MPPENGVHVQGSSVSVGPLGEVADAIDQLTERDRRLLRLGPMEEPDCRICSALTHDGHHCRSDAAEVIVDFHRAEFSDKLMACAGMLGTDMRPTRDEVERLRGALIDSEGSDLRRGIDTLGEQLGFMRCLYVYMLAGWKP